MRCDAPLMTCGECIANMVMTADAPQAAPILDPPFGVVPPGWPTYTLGSVTLGSTIMGQTPPPAHVPSTMAKVKLDLNAIGRVPAAAVIRDWLYTAFPWSSSQQGDPFWTQVYNEFDEIARGRAP